MKNDKFQDVIISWHAGQQAEVETTTEAPTTTAPTTTE